MFDLRNRGQRIPHDLRHAADKELTQLAGLLGENDAVTPWTTVVVP